MWKASLIEKVQNVVSFQEKFIRKATFSYNEKPDRLSTILECEKTPGGRMNRKKSEKALTFSYNEKSNV